VKRPDATRIFYGMEFFDTLGAQAAFTVWAVYLVQDVGVNPLQLVLLGTVSEIAIFLFEVPTGVVADTYSRRLSIIIGMILAGLSLVIFGLVAVYWVIVLAVVLRGIGGTFMSGAWEAWITDEHGVEGIGRVFLRGNQFSYLGAIAGAALGVGIATWDLGAGIVFGGIVSVLTGIACIFVMPEHGFQRRPVEERRSAPCGRQRSRAGSSCAGTTSSCSSSASRSSPGPHPRASTDSGRRTCSRTSGSRSCGAWIQSSGSASSTSSASPPGS
jgi:MFS transporter, DHA3 family, tetracycline resistance protein